MEKADYFFTVLLHKKAEIIAILLVSIGLTGLQAQETVTTAGGNASGTGGTMSYSVGQLVYTTNTGTNGSLAQGVQQPNEISIATGIEEARGITLEFVIYPNPATDFVILKTGNYEVVNLRYQLFDINGILLENRKVESQETNISMETYLPSTYFLKITDKNAVIKTFKIIKY
jgi:hypothetical protein